MTSETGMTKRPNSAEKGIVRRQLFLLAIFSALATTLLASTYPSGRPVDEVVSLSFAASYGWLLSQSLGLALILFLGALFLTFVNKKWGSVSGSFVILCLPYLFLADLLTFAWIGERFLSSTMAHIFKSLLPALSLHITPFAAFQACLTLTAMMVMSWLFIRASRYIARLWESRKESIGVLSAFSLSAFLMVLLSIQPFMNWETLRDEMYRASNRHPLCAFHFVGFRGVGVAVSKESVPLQSSLRALDTYEAVREREIAMLDIALDTTIEKSPLVNASDINVILVVVECLRPEVISPELMPNLHAFSKKGISLRQHFSGGNSTCLGMFSFINGLESIWFHRQVAEKPILNRILSQAGYQLAFYGGQTDWRIYEMDGFVHEQHYDDFMIENPDLPKTDLNAVMRTLDFLERPTEHPSRDSFEGDRKSSVVESKNIGEHRAAICYLYGTHSSFRYSDEKYRIFTPEADEGLLISNAPELKEQFYNRYKNSLRSMDDTLKPLLRDDCVVIVMGDHGEPFLDDGTASHGTRLSRYQNMSPAIVYYPGIQPRVIDAPTFHADLLPTLFSILGLSLSRSDVLDGIDLTSLNNRDLENRVFASGNFMDPSVLLVGPWTTSEGKPFGYRVVHDIFRWQTAYLNPIDELGYEIEDETGQGQRFFSQWFQTRFGRPFKKEIDEAEVLQQSIESSAAEVRMAALEVVSSIQNPNDEIIRNIEKLTKDENQEIRLRAKEVMIDISRSRSWSALFD